MLGNAQNAAVQRDVGFEFESRKLLTRPLSSSLKSEKKRTAPADAGALGRWTDSFTLLPKYTKNVKLLTSPDVNLTADDSGGESDAEFVTKPFPEDDAGRRRLDSAFDAMDAFDTRVAQQRTDRVALLSDLKGGHFGVADRNAAFIRPGEFPRGFFGAPQMTIGLGLADIPTIIEDLIGVRANEPAMLTQQRRPGRAAVRTATQATPALGGAKGLVDAIPRADDALANFAASNARDKPFANAAGASRELRGLLVLIYSITETARDPAFNAPYLKMASDLLAKTDYAKLFHRLPLKEILYFRSDSGRGTLWFTELVGSAGTYQGTMGRPVFDSPNKIFYDERKAIDASGQPFYEDKEWYKALTLQAWVEGMAKNVDLLTTDKFPNLPKGRKLEGFGNLGRQQDTSGARHLPIFELRSFAGSSTVSQFHQRALKLFDYVRSVNAGNPHRIQ